MALVKCPECGREVSDTAVSCPGCGYAVKDHFAKIEVVKKEEEPVKILAKLVECKKCGAKLNQGTKMCFKCGASLEQSSSFDNNTINNRKPEPENQVAIGLGLVAVAFISLFLPFIQLGNLALSLAQIQLVLPILGLSLGLTAIFVIKKKKSGVIAMNVFSILFTAYVYHGEFADNSALSRFVSPGIGAFLLPIALIGIWVYYAKLKKEYGLAPAEKSKKGLIIGIVVAIVGVIVVFAIIGATESKDGKYMLTNVNGADASLLAINGENPDEYYIDVDGSKCTVSFGSQGKTEGEVKFSGDECKITTNGVTNVFDYDSSDKTITISYEGNTLVFKK